MVSLTHTHCPPSISYTPILLIYTIPFFACWSSVSPSGRRRSRPTRRVPPAKKTKKAHVFQSLPKCRTPTFAICPKLNSNLGKGEQKTLVFQSLPKCRTPTFAICPELNSNLGRPFLCIETMENFPHSNALFLPYVAPPPFFPPYDPNRIFQRCSKRWRLRSSWGIRPSR